MILKRLRNLQKILIPHSRVISTFENYPFYQPSMFSSLPKSDLVKFHAAGPVRIVELDRSAALHAINLEMVQVITEALRIWESTDSCKIVILKSNNSKTKVKSFCAGGDVVSIATGEQSLEKKREFFQKEYALNHLIGTFKKPIISLLDGITMGGGVGLSVHGRFRIATENTVFAMPETAIGFFPDVGGSFFLPRMEGFLGEFLALTGIRLKGFDNYHAGVATHFVPSTRIDSLVESLCHSGVDTSNLPSYIEQFSGELESFSLIDKMNDINWCFSAVTLTEILKRLEDINNEWSKNVLDTLRTMSPTSMAVTVDLLQKGRRKTFKKCLEMEYALAKNFLTNVPDMLEGVTSKLVRKEKVSKWNPSKIEDVNEREIQNLFINDQPFDTVEFYNHIDFEEYPHNFGLPTTAQIKEWIQRNRSREDLDEMINIYCKERNQKLGLMEKLKGVVGKHVMSRKELESRGQVALSSLNWID